VHAEAFGGEYPGREAADHRLIVHDEYVVRGAVGLCDRHARYLVAAIACISPREG
jgi:hypothetical protein